MSDLPSETHPNFYIDDLKWWRTPSSKLTTVIIVAFLALFPIFAPTNWLNAAYTISYYILAALGVQLLVGYCGQITLGHAAFIAVGGYCSALMVLFVPWPEFVVNRGLFYPISIVCAGTAAGLWSVLFGFPAVRIKGHFLIVTTVAAQWITVPLIVALFVGHLADSSGAVRVPPASLSIGFFVMDSGVKIYYFSVILVAFCLVIAGNMLRSKIGRAWVAIREDETAAQTVGVNILTNKLLALFVAGVFAGIAGALNLAALRTVSPEHYGWDFSLLLVAIVLIGGIGSIRGLVLGSFFVVLMFNLLELSVTGLSGLLSPGYSVTAFLSAKMVFLKEAFLGLVLIFFLLYAPKGLNHWYLQLKDSISRRPFTHTAKDA